jgi:hypothetical protein
VDLLTSWVVGFTNREKEIVSISQVAEAKIVHPIPYFLASSMFNIEWKRILSQNSGLATLQKKGEIPNNLEL